MIDVLCRTRDQVSERSEFLSLYELILQTLLVLVSPARLLQQRHESLVLDILAQKHERSQQQHRNQHGASPEDAGGLGRFVEPYGPQPQHRQRQERQHGQPRNYFLPSRVETELDAFQLPFPCRHGGRRHPGHRGQERNIVQASRVVGVILYRTVEKLGTNSVQGSDSKKMQIEPPPSAETSPCRQSEDHHEQGVLQQVQPVIGGVVRSDVQHHVLVRKHEKGVKKDPPSQQHQKIHRAEMHSSFFFHQIRTPGHRRDHRQQVKEKNDVKEIRVGNRSMQHQ